ncbi:pyrroloquinoline quinone biosynthesis protein PqqB [Leisingera sp. MMG026]|uniref:pyrroloquinoline quinone biosynthesis protein PqqB n=1 Tax=Leisingera sp. MMG026 TaxID=2909982 RepID=UPI001F00253C|nr:pyrroloquinoline quinone biosynthesis protein PqqB [Leisingera sp. MMG026]MCF6432750.1 pyrroloquinoline quinone biosynthesis protein PqqB [Leisingera sp. MMG026]
MRFLVLGAAAGGGLPQWNCGCRNCRDARLGRIASATQSSLAVTLDGQNWAVLNTSPDIRVQLQNCPSMHPQSLRHCPLRAVLLTNGDIDHIAGLLSLREQSPFSLFATAGLLELLSANPVFNALPAAVDRNPVRLSDGFELLPGLQATVFAVPGKVPLFLEGGQVETDLMGEQTVGVRLTDGTKTAYYIPGCSAVSAELLEILADADHIFFDGTLWHDQEMIQSGTGTKTGQRMGHISISGPLGSIASLRNVDAAKTFIHINNTNPVWQPGSAERAQVLAAGWTIAADGMEIAL